jgi:energy-coupling factor transporter transmembrane protein EcfT
VGLERPDDALSRPDRSIHVRGVFLHRITLAASPRVTVAVFAIVYVVAATTPTEIAPGIAQILSASNTLKIVIVDPVAIVVPVGPTITTLGIRVDDG